MIKQDVDLCIIGAGAGGLTIAAVAAQMGLSVTLVEAKEMGGDCLNTGCIPSKTLLAAAGIARQTCRAHEFGLVIQSINCHFLELHQRIRAVIDTVAVHDSVERFKSLGVNVILGAAQFKDHRSIEVNHQIIKAKRFVIATGSSPRIPFIQGLDQVPYLTNETLFNLAERPERLLIIGGGPIGCEMAQAYALLGVPVVLLEAGSSILGKEDPQLVALLREQFKKDGIVLYENCHIDRLEQHNGEIEIHFNHCNSVDQVKGSHVLLAAGRVPNIFHLSLDRANVEYTQKGIIVRNNLKTTNPSIFAIGDVVPGAQFTHRASYHASIVLRQLLFRLPSRTNEALMPSVVYTYPELAQVGMSIKEAEQAKTKYKILEWPLLQNDRAQTECDQLGMIKIIVDRRGRVLGVSILSQQAGELLAPWLLMMHNKLKVRSIAEMILPYPTLSEISKRVASSYYQPFLFSNWMKRVVKFLQKF